MEELSTQQSEGSENIQDKEHLVRLTSAIEAFEKDSSESNRAILERSIEGVAPANLYLTQDDGDLDSPEQAKERLLTMGRKILQELK